MALSNPGPASTLADLNATNTLWADISPILKPPIYSETNFLGSLMVGEPAAVPQFYWNEDSLNSLDFVSTSGAQNNTDTAGTAVTITFAPADAAHLRVGDILSDSAGAGGFDLGEQEQVTAVSGGNVTATRGYASTTITTHAANATWRKISGPRPQSSDVGVDESRNRGAVGNVIQTFDKTIRLSAEVLLLAEEGYRPGVPNEMALQANRRMIELRREINQAVINSRLQVPNSLGTLGAGYPTMAGVVQFLDGSTGNGATVYSATGDAAGLGAALNNAYFGLSEAGAYCDTVVLPGVGVRQLSKLNSDQIRIQYNDMNTRGFWATTFVTDTGDVLRVIRDSARVAPNAGPYNALMLDTSRIELAPLNQSACYMITAPTLIDGDVVRILSKLSLRVRNAGSFAGQAHRLLTGIPVV